MTLQPKRFGRNAHAIDLDRCHAASDRQRGLSRRSQALIAAAGMDAPERRWFVITVHTGMDRKVAETLLFANVECWLPDVIVKQPRRGGCKVGQRPVSNRLAMPGYVFARVTATIESWSALASVKGASGVLGMSGRPVAVGDDKVSFLRAYLDNDPQARDTVIDMLKTGDRVSVRNGPFRAFPGLVGDVDADRGRATVEIIIFGRATPVALDLDQISKL